MNTSGANAFHDLVDMCVGAIDLQLVDKSLLKVTESQPFASLPSVTSHCNFTSELSHADIVAALRSTELLVVGDSTYRRLSAAINALQDNKPTEYSWAHWTLNRSSDFVRHQFVWMPRCSDALGFVRQLSTLDERATTIKGTGTPYGKDIQGQEMPCYNKTRGAAMQESCADAPGNQDWKCCAKCLKQRWQPDLVLGNQYRQLVILVGYASHDAIEAATSSERYHKDQGSYTTPDRILKCGEDLVHAMFSKYGLIATATNTRVRDSVVLLFEGNDFKEMFHLRGILQSFYANHRGAYRTLKMNNELRDKSFLIQDSYMMTQLMRPHLVDSMHLHENAKVTQGMLVANVLGCLNGAVGTCHVSNTLF